MRLLGLGVVQKQKCLMRFSQTGNASTRLDWAGRRGRRAGKRPQGMAKRLTFTEGRLRLPIGTTRPESQAFRQLRGGPMEAALNFSLTFLSREKEGKRKIVLLRFRRWRIKSAMRVKGR